MGNWNMTVVGTGSHHNTSYDKDANRLFAAFVKSLTDAGHMVQHASFTFGGSELVKSDGLTESDYTRRAITTARMALAAIEQEDTGFGLPDSVVQALRDLLPTITPL